ncbi:MAG TPA: tetratricopeptide repeat protein [Pseudonocardiaceae bacterium]|jgi:tetratricopeptide (TPR) repeat protein|nr:tetratricopeptide repeat protein [Pseudonocardiaceae bacterium]
MHPGVGRLLLESEIRDGAIRADATRRTAFVIAGGHALTARHCSADATSDDPLWLRLPAPDDPFGTVDLPVRVLDEDAALDVAVLGLDDSGRAARGDISERPAAELWRRVPPVPVGLPATAGDAVRTEGYPRDGRDGGLAFSGNVVEPEARLLQSRACALQLYIDELAASTPHGPGGHSGGPVRTAGQGLAVGVVRAYPPDETRVYAVGGSLLATRLQDLIPRFPAVQEAFAQRAAEVLGQGSAAVREAAESLATLIRADARQTRFFGREPELAQLQAWCTSDAVRAALLMTGPAGQGKTRLARHFCEQLTAAGEWVAVPLRGVGSDGEISDGLRLAALAGRPLLLAVDYAAEYGAAALLALVDQLCTHGPSRWRLLLIARHTGDWWNGQSTTTVMSGLQAAETEVDEKPLQLAELAAAGDDRQRAYDIILNELRDPVTGFADRHGLSVSAEPLTPPLQRSEYGSALMLHIAAVCALLPGSGPGTESAQRLDPTKVIDRFLDLERDHHWLYRDTHANLHHATTQAFADLATGEPGRYRVETAVAAATLTGAATLVEACELTTTALGVEPSRAELIARWLRDLYPPPTETVTGSILHPLQPDLLGEELVTRVLRRQLDDGETQDRLLPFALIGTSSETQTQRMLTVLIRAAERHAWIADLLTSPDRGEPSSNQRGLLSRIRRGITKRRPQRASAADSGGLLSRIPISTELDVVHDALPLQNTHLLRVAVQLTQRLLDQLDQLYGRTTRNAAALELTARRALILNNLAIRLAEVGRRTEALTRAQEAVNICRRLARDTPTAHLPHLAMSLNTLARGLAETGQHAEALAPAQEAVNIYRRLAQDTPAAYLPHLAMSLNNLALHLGEVGQRTEALTHAQEAVEIRRRLAQDTPAAYLPGLANSLNMLAVGLAKAGRHAEALAPAQEATQLHRRLVETAPAAYLPRLAMSLGTLARGLAETGQHAGALAPAQEAVDIYRRLAQDTPAAYLPRLAMSLNNLANRLAETAQRTKALVPAQEAVNIYRRLAQDTPAAHLPDLAMSLNDLAVLLAEVGRHDRALTPTQEATQLYRRLAETAPAAYLPGLAMSLGTLANRLAETGQPSEALACAQEATQLYRCLAQDTPAAHLPDLAMSLNNLAIRLAETGQRTKALIPAQEAVSIRRCLAKTIPAAYLPDLAVSLDNLAILMTGIGRDEEARSAEDEASRIWEQLA